MASVIGSDDDWENEDPNLLNNPELLFRECEKLPPIEDGEGSRESDKEFWEAVSLIRELILDHNIVLEAVSKREEFRGTKEDARIVIENVITTFQADCAKNDDIFKRYEEMPCWEEAIKKKIFSTRSAERVIRWKAALQAFLESYLKIRKFIPKEALEKHEEEHQTETEREDCKRLQIVVEELEALLASLE